MSATTVRLLHAASEILKGNRALARHLGISERVLARYMADQHPCPDALLLRAVDVILADRHEPFMDPHQRAPKDPPAEAP